MYVTVSSFHVNEENINKDIALGCFKRLVLPAMQQQAGYQGTVVLRTAEGKGMVLSLWDSEASAQQSNAANGYSAEMDKLAPILEPPSLADQYAVVFTDSGSAGDAHAIPNDGGFPQGVYSRSAVSASTP